MNPSELKHFLDGLLNGGVDLSTMIWGPPGIGKSSIVHQVADARGFEVVDVSPRLAQPAKLGDGRAVVPGGPRYRNGRRGK